MDTKRLRGIRNSDNGLEGSPRGRRAPDRLNDALGSVAGTTRQHRVKGRIALPGFGILTGIRQEPFGIAGDRKRC